MSFKPQDHLMNMRGKDYLEVKWRMVWFREEHPLGCISTELASTDPVVIKASVLNEDGKLLATGFGTPKQQGVAAKRPFEGAETAAIGRALAVAGYGTQFTGEEEGEHLADSPLVKEAKKLATKTDTTQIERPFTPEQLKDAMTNAVNKLGQQTATKKQRGMMVGLYDAILGDGINRYEVCEYLFGARSSKKLSGAQVLAALNHINKDEGLANKELHAVFNISQKDKGQKELI